MPLTRADCQAMDRRDPLAKLRRRFVLPEAVVYLDGNSLGAMPKTAPARAEQVIGRQWAIDLIRSWNTAGWFDLPQRLGNKLARLIGAQDGEVVVTDTTSINLFKVLAAALRVQHDDDPRRRVIVSERDNFPTDLYIAQGLLEHLSAHGAGGFELRLVDEPAQLADALGNDVAVLMLTHVNYRTGYMHDLVTLTEQAHAAGALVVWDLAHSAGAVPVDLNGAGADYAVGCTYKYLNGGPGAPAFLWVHARHRSRFAQPLSGWWGHARPFAMNSHYEPHPGIERFLCGTQPIASLAMVECGLDIFAETDIQALRDKSLALGALLIDLVQQQCAGFALKLITPLDPARRGSQVCFEHPDAFAIVQAMIDDGVITDYREPHVMRFGFAPLYIGYEDVWQAVAVLQQVLRSESWNQPQYLRRRAVT